MTAATAGRSVSADDLGIDLDGVEPAEAVDEPLGHDERGGDDGWGVVDEVGLDVELAEASGLAGFEVVGSLAGAAGVEAWLLAVELLLLQLGGAGIPVPDLAIQSFLDRAPCAFDAGLGDVGDLSEVWRWRGWLWPSCERFGRRHRRPSGCRGRPEVRRVSASSGS